MPREKELFRVNLDRIDSKFPNQELLSYNDISDYTKMSLSFVKQHFKDLRVAGGVPKCNLARFLCGKG